MLKLAGSQHFRHRIIAATLTGKQIVISDIRALEEHPGITDFEASLLRLVEKITNGCTIQINETGTRVLYKPGAIIGGKVIHDCGTSRGIGYFLEAVLCLAPFGKSPLQITFTGITNEYQDLSVDLLRTVTLPLLKFFGIEDGVQLKVLARGAPPKGGGKVSFTCPVVKTLKPINLVEQQKIVRVRGIAYSTRVSPQIGNRIGEAARGVLNPFAPNCFIYTDHYKGNESGMSPGFGLTLVAESSGGLLFSAEAMATAGMLPEDLGKQTSEMLLQEILKGGCIDTFNQPLVLLFMVLCQDNVSSVCFGKLSPFVISYLRHLREFFGVQFNLLPQPETKTVVLKCSGCGFQNYFKRVY